jgi:hypothetical protein
MKFVTEKQESKEKLMSLRKRMIESKEPDHDERLEQKQEEEEESGELATNNTTISTIF